MAGKTVAVIPVRGNSKSIPLKNIKPIGGKPLVHWVIKAALDADGIDEVYLATDSEAIRSCVAGFADRTGFHVIDRLPENATDTASTESVLLEFAEGRDFETLILIQATSPLLTAADLERGLERRRSGEVDSVLSAVNQKRFIWDVDPASGIASPVNYDYMNRPLRQAFDGCFVENGAFYITSRARLLEHRCRLSGRIGVVEMPAETFVELDEPEDWAVVDLCLRKRDRSDEARQLRKLRMLMLDFDGVLTDDRVFVDENGTESVACSRGDGMGLALLRKQTDLEVRVISTERNPVVARRCDKLNVAYSQGCDDKLSLLKEICAERGLAPENVAYMGNDVNDLACLRLVGFSAAPADAHPDVLACADFVSEKRGGHGAFRELADWLVQEIGGRG